MGISCQVLEPYKSYLGRNPGSGGRSFYLDQCFCVLRIKAPRSPGVGSVIISGSMTRYYWVEEIRLQLRCYIILLQTTAGKVPTRWRLGPGKIGDSNIYLEPISFLSHSRREQRIGGGNLVLTAMIYLRHRNPASSAPILTGIVAAAGDKEPAEGAGLRLSHCSPVTVPRFRAGRCRLCPGHLYLRSWALLS